MMHNDKQLNKNEDSYQNQSEHFPSQNQESTKDTEIQFTLKPEVQTALKQNLICRCLKPCQFSNSFQVIICCARLAFGMLLICYNVFTQFIQMKDFFRQVPSQSLLYHIMAYCLAFLIIYPIFPEYILKLKIQKDLQQPNPHMTLLRKMHSQISFFKCHCMLQLIIIIILLTGLIQGTVQYNRQIIDQQSKSKSGQTLISLNMNIYLTICLLFVAFAILLCLVFWWVLKSQFLYKQLEYSSKYNSQPIIYNQSTKAMPNIDNNNAKHVKQNANNQDCDDFGNKQSSVMSVWEMVIEDSQILDSLHQQLNSQQDSIVVSPKYSKKDSIQIKQSQSLSSYSMTYQS